MAYIWILLIVIILLLGFLIYLNIKDSSQSSDSKESLRDLDKAVERQEATLFDLTKDIQSFQDPLNKLNRYLSGGTLAGKFGEWSLEAIIKDIFHSNQFIANAEVIPGSGKRVEFAIKLPEGLLLPIDAKFPSGLFDNYLLAVDAKDQQLVKKSKDDIKRHVLSDAKDINIKYMQSGITIELGVMYIPSESLMQLIDSMANLREEIFRDHRVLIMGPNSLAAYLISVHMGFRTLALNERAGEIMNEFGKLKKEFETKKVNCEKMDMNVKEDYQAIGYNKFDTIICSNVLEHVEKDQFALEQCFSLLKNKGKLILIVPQNPNLFSKQDKELGHFRRYTKNEVIKKSEKLGYEILDIKNFNSIGVIGWKLNKKSKQTKNNPKMIKIFNSIIPLVKGIDDSITSKFFGLSLISILKKT